MSVRAYLYDAAGQDREVKLEAPLADHLTDEQLLWVDVTGTDRNELERVGGLLHLHRESIRNLLNPIERPRLDNYKDYFQVNVVSIEAPQGGARGRYRTASLDFFSGPNYVVTVHAQEVAFLRDFDATLKGDSDLGRLTSSAFLAALLDWQITGYFRVLEGLEDRVDRLDEEVLTRPEDRKFLSLLVDLRREVSELRRVLSPHREVFAALARPDFEALATSESAAHFRALEDRFERAMDAVESARDLVLGSFDLYMTGTSQRTNDVVRLLTVVTVMTGFMGVIAGIMGMNFEVSFFKAGSFGFELTLAGMGVLVVTVLVVARLRRWI